MEWILSAAHWFGSAVCHQFPEHSYHVAGAPLPLCARCTGLYLGALLTLIFHVWRHPRAVGLPRPWMLVVLVLFFFAWAGDGLNSFLSIIPIAPHLYSPQNLLRLITGTLMGITIGSLVFVMFNSLVWRTPSPDAIFATRREFFALLGLGALLAFIIHSEFAPLLYLLNLAVLIAIPVLHVALVTAFLSSFRPRVSAWRGTLLRLAASMLITFAYLSPIAWLHEMLVKNLPY
jgi:uncharacterized membrane protein